MDVDDAVWLAWVELPHRESTLYTTGIGERLGPLCGPNSSIPIEYALLLLSKHLNTRERFKLTLFVLGNGVDPCKYVHWLRRRRGVLADESARREIAGLIQRFAFGKLDRFSTYMLDAVSEKGDPLPANRRYFQVDAPPWLQRSEHRHFWKDACTLANARQIG